MDSKNTESETTNAPAGSSQTHTDQDFLVVWLDANIDPLNNDYQNKITKLREVSNTVNTFTDLDGCVSFIADINDKIAFMICSGTLGETVVPVVHDMAQVSTISFVRIRINMTNGPNNGQKSKVSSRILNQSMKI
jgi:hypothetical protein